MRHPGCLNLESSFCLYWTFGLLTTCTVSIQGYLPPLRDQADLLWVYFSVTGQHCMCVSLYIVLSDRDITLVFTRPPSPLSLLPMPVIYHIK